jgi:hypothetical protein
MAKTAYAVTVVAVVAGCMLLPAAVAPREVLLLQQVFCC